MGRLIIIVALFFSIAGAIVLITRSPHIKDWLGTENKHGLVIVNGKQIAVEIARTDSQVRKGLSGRNDLEEDAGMLFLFEYPERYTFWMKGMRFSIDIVWIRDGKVVDITHNLPVPAQDSQISDLPRFMPKEPANTVLELKAGSVRKYNIEIGDVVNDVE